MARDLKGEPVLRRGRQGTPEKGKSQKPRSRELQHVRGEKNIGSPTWSDPGVALEGELPKEGVSDLRLHRSCGALRS